MLVLTQATTEAKSRRGRKWRYLVSYKRRYWDIETQSFKLEADYTQAGLNQGPLVSETRESLDRARVNEFQTANITISLKNNDNEWSPQNPQGNFAVDAIARLGYEPQLMEFKVEQLYELRDGTLSAAIPVFVGRAANWDYSPPERLAMVTLQSKNVVLERNDAENVSDTETDKGLEGTVDGVNKEFLSPDTGVGIVDETRVGTVVQNPGTDVKISQLATSGSADPDEKAKFEFTVAPTVQPKADYRVWKKNQKNEDLVELLLQEAGFVPADYNVSPVTYPFRVLNTNLHTTQVDWDAGVQTDLDTGSTPGDVLLDSLSNPAYNFDDFDDGSFSDGTPRTWTVQAGGGASWSVVGGVLRATRTTGFLSIIDTPSAQAVGSWEFRHAWTGGGSGNSIFWFMWDGNRASGNGYGISLLPSIVGQGVRLVKLTGGALSTLGQAFNEAQDTAFHTYRVTKTAGGSFNVYKDGAFGFTVVDGAHTTSAFISCEVLTPVAGPVKDWDDIRASATIFPATENFIATGNIVSQVIDAGADFLAWLRIVSTQSIPSGTTTLVETTTAPESFPGSGVPGTFEGFTAIDGSGNIQSTQQRFLKFRWTGTADTPRLLAPSLSDLTTTFHTSTARIRLAIFKGLTVLRAVRELAEIANYEFGWDRSGKFFFRPRAFSTTPVFEVNITNYRGLERISDGDDRVFNEIRATYGTSERTVNPRTQNDPRPDSFDKFGRRRLNIGGSKQILLDPDADVATGLSISYLEDFKNPRRRFFLTVDTFPEVELGDTGLLKIADRVPDPLWHIGDTTRSMGDRDIRLYGSAQQSAHNVKARVLNYAHNSMADTTRLEMEEII